MNNFLYVISNALCNIIPCNYGIRKRYFIYHDEKSTGIIFLPPHQLKLLFKKLINFTPLVTTSNAETKKLNEIKKKE